MAPQTVVDMTRYVSGATCTKNSADTNTLHCASVITTNYTAKTTVLVLSKCSHKHKAVTKPRGQGLYAI